MTSTGQASIDALLAAIRDESCDAVELTRRALVFARAHDDAFHVASSTDEAIVAAGLAQRGFVSVLTGRPCTVDLTPEVRAGLAGAMESALAGAPAEGRSGLEALVAHKLALALEEAFGARFFDHLAAGGARVLGPDDMLAFASAFRDAKGAFRRAYGADLAPDPARLAQRPDSLRAYGRLAPQVPHAARLRWVPTWTVLDDLTPASTVVAVLPGTFDELEVPVEEHPEGRRFFGVRPRDPARRLAIAEELVAKADAADAHVVLLPEVSLHEAGVEALARWVETEARSIRVAVCGSAHRAPEGVRENVALIAAAREGTDYARAEQPKLVPFVMRIGQDAIVEDIQHAGRVLTFLSGRRFSLLVVICMDLIDQDLSRLAHDLRPSLVLVPACTATTGPFESVARDLAARSQAHVVIANQRAEGRGEPDAALVARPRREGRDAVCASPADGADVPGVRRTTLAEGGWRTDL